MDFISQILKQEFNLKEFQIINTVKLIDDGNTIPFIARYRKEMTGELNDQVLRELNDRLSYLRNLEARKEEVRRLIKEQEKLTQDIEEAILKCKTLQEIEDIYRPFRPKRKTKASVAKEKGLEPLAEIIFSQDILKGDIYLIAKEYINEEKGVLNEQEALQGAKDIIAENISDNALYRKKIRYIIFTDGILISRASGEEESVYEMYYDFKEPIRKIAKHRVLAIDRGEKEGYLKVTVEEPKDKIFNYLYKEILKENESFTKVLVKESIEDAYKRLIFPSIEREIRNELTDAAHENAIKIFKENLKNLLLQRPVKGNVVLGLDPAYRTGCKLAVVDETGKVLTTDVIYPTLPQNKVKEANEKVKKMIDTYGIGIIAIGNGTASKESEIFISDLIKEVDRELYYMIVSEAGASVYSASKLGSEEFPDFDVALRSAVSIARRLQDPLAELVKIDPKAIGVGQYQHDINQKKLGHALSGVVEDCVNSVGVDLNTASPSLLKYIAGINGTIAKNIVMYRESNGIFTDRKQLLKVEKLGPKAFEQCAGFLRITESKNLLDNTAVHPESYKAVEKLFGKIGFESEQDSITSLGSKLKDMDLNDIASFLGLGIPTLKDIVSELIKPGRDPRDELPRPILLKNILDIKDLKSGMILNGTVRNVIDFGAFIDIGVHQDGLIHISQISDKFVKNPLEMLSVGDIVKVKILDIDIKRKRISLTMRGV
jgi:uncharacterized protein